MLKFEPMSGNAVTKAGIRKVQHGSMADVEDVLATEEPLEIRIIYGTARTKKNLAVTMRTPGNDAELATGFGLGEYRSDLYSGGARPPSRPR